MVEKMKYVNLAGPIAEMDGVVDEYLSRYDIQLEDAVTELGHTKGIQPFHISNPYAITLSAAAKLLENLELDRDKAVESDMSLPRAIEIINTAEKYYEEHSESEAELTARRELYIGYLELIGHYANIDFDIDKLRGFRFIDYRFGHMPISSFRQFETFLYDEEDVLLVQGKSDGESIWALYFVPVGAGDRVDSVFSSLHFERMEPGELNGEKLSGTPAELHKEFKRRLASLNEEMQGHRQLRLADIGLTPEQLLAAYWKIEDTCYHYDARKRAGRSSEDFYIFVGWMTEKDALALAAELEHDDRVVFIIEEDNDAIVSDAPTKLKNNPLFSPFEFFVRMYGLPAYNEIDPTPFVAVTYTLMFGLMFGDVGQGAVLSLLGLYLYRKKKMALGAVMGIIGLSSMFFGFMYGSVFGLEELIPAIWMRPAHSINQILFVTVALGISLIGISMLFNMYNSFRRKDWGELFLSPNGMAGLVFYGAMIAVVLSVATGSQAPDLLIAGGLIIPLALMALREPIAARKEFKRVKLSQFILETVIELFEVLLSYFTNTVSFVRIGAFALSHAGMMGVVLLLSESASGYNPLILIIGNIIVICLEGLVVGIQGLRLEFYEMFSRFFKGSGREFVSYRGGGH